ncbi:MAG: helix-turn-helix domain-containing protein [Endomicrobiales bacterium]|nr:helix-turn-helix domain-containing protein [Endomicrobiales bacterium]
MSVKKFFNGDLEIMDIATLAKQLKIHKVTLLRKIREKKLFAQRIGRSYWISKNALKAFLDNGLFEEAKEKDKK